MGGQNFEQVARLGRVVALEGDEGAISTQLQLLPQASNILILPSILDSIPIPEKGQLLEIRAFVRKVHTVLTEQKALARSFIGSPTNGQPRLALMHGATLGARAACITQICDRITDGDLDEAEKVLESILKEGVTGLERDVHPGNLTTSTALATLSTDDEPVAQDQNPTLEAMEAAEFLDRETQAFLKDADQLPQLDTDWTTADLIPTRHSSETSDHDDASIVSESRGSKAQDHSIPAGLEADQLGDQTAPSAVKLEQSVTAPNETKSVQPWAKSLAQHQRVYEPRSRVRDAVKALNLGGSVAKATPTSIPGQPSLALPDTPFTTQSLEDYDYASSEEDTAQLAKGPARPVRMGEAHVVEVQSSKPSPPRRSSIRKSRSCHQLRSLMSSASLHHHNASLDDLSILQSTIASLDMYSSSLEQLPQTTYGQGSLNDFSADFCTTRPASLRIPSRMHRSSDLDVTSLDPTQMTFDSEKEVVSALEHVFSITEDAIIHIPGDAESPSVKALFAAYNDYLHPTRNSPSTLPSEQSPRTPTAHDLGHTIPVSKFAITTAQDIQYDLQDFDPYRPDDFDEDISEEVPYSEPPKSRHSHPSAIIETIPGLDGSIIYPLSSAESGTAVDLQCSLRALLRERFPACEGHSNHHFFAASKADRLWNPVFSNHASSVSGEEHRTVDQIIAIGCEHGVSKDFLSQITGQVERLGMKRNGVSQSGCLDLRYLLTNVMQTQSTQTSLVGPMSERLLDAKLLATLLVPQLEMYLATSTSVRLLLIQYPPSHLPIVLALRDLIGSKLMKVAGILDSNASEPTQIPQRPINPLSNEAIVARIERLKKTNGDKRDYLKELLAQPLPPLPDSSSSRPTTSIGTVSFSRADYVLPSTSTDIETMNFLEAVLKNLVERSSWYTPEAEPESPPPTAPLPPLPSTPTLRKLHQLPPRNGTQPPLSFKAPKALNHSTLNALIANSPTLLRHNYAPSIASSIRTTTTTATERSRKRVRQLERDWENFYIGSEDEEDDDYDRMVMGRRGARIVPVERPLSGEFVKHQPPTKKALRWLGLA